MTTINYAHRGARSLAPENTMVAYQQAHTSCADGIEVDLQLTADLQLVLFHDRTLERTTNVSERFPNRSAEPIHHFSLAELQTLDAGSWFINRDPFGTIKTGEVSAAAIETFRNSTIPTFAELLAFLSENQLKLNLELKPLASKNQLNTLITLTLEQLERSGLNPARLSISSFQHQYLAAILKYRQDLALQALIDFEITNQFLAELAPIRIINANARHLTYPQYQRARARGFSVNLYTVNDPAKMQEFLRWGVAGIITDFPQQLSALIKNG